MTEYLVAEEPDVARALQWLEAQAADTDFSRFPGVRWRNPIL